jgi:hypothetical protein
MTMPSSRDLWRDIWKFATGDLTTATLLVVIGVILLTTTWLPQMPSPDPTVYARWLAEVRARFGPLVPLLQSVGLFTVSSSPAFRAILALLGGCFLLRVIEGMVQLRHGFIEWKQEHHSSRLRDRIANWPWSLTSPAAATAGGLLLILSLLVNCLWGWEQGGLVIQGGERLTLSGTAGWVALSDTAQRITHSEGLTVHVDERGPGVLVHASDKAGGVLMLQQAAGDEPVSQLKLPLVLDQYFAIPEAHLIVRLIPQHEGQPEASSPISVQLYRVPSGQLAAQTLLESDGEVLIDGITIHFTAFPYARLTVVHNPARGITLCAIILLVAGLVGDALCTGRHRAGVAYMQTG